MRYFLIAACLSVTTTCREKLADPPGDEPSVVRVGARDIPVSEFSFYLQRAYPELSESADDELMSRVYDSFERDLMIYAYANNIGMKVSEERIDNFIEQQMTSITFNLLEPQVQLSWRREIERRLVIQRFLQREIIDRIQIEDEAISAYYEGHPDEFVHPALYRIRHAQTSSLEEANAFRAALKKSNEPFTKVAAQFSENEAYRLAAELPLAEMPAAFQKALARIAPGQYTKVVELQYGDLTQYHVLYLESVIAEVEEPFDSAYQRIKSELEKEASEKRLLELTEHMRANVPVTRNLKNLSFTYKPAEKDGDAS